MDAAVRGDKATISCLIRDHLGKPLGDWTSQERVFDVFYVEAKGFLLACQVGSELNLRKFLIEGDSLGVVTAINGDDSQVIWTSKEIVLQGRSFTHKFPLWSFVFIPRSFNVSAHKLA